MNSFLKSVSRIIWVVTLLGVLAVALLFILIANTKMPDTAELENPRYEFSTIIYSSDMQELGRSFRFNRENLDFESINPKIIKALIATEDERYHRHNGIDIKGTMRAVMFMGKRGGASTITQQLAKLFFTSRSSNIVKRIWQKLKEWVIAIQFERRYTKEEIISMYLNKFDFLYNSYGVGPAAQTYFQKNQRDLTVDEAAILVGMLKNPSLYNPKKYPTNATKRRNVVMKQMVKNGYLLEEDYDYLKKKPIDASKFQRTIHYDGVAPYFRASLVNHIKQLLNDDKYSKPDGTKYNIYEDGLKIYTTIDMEMQKLAEKAVTEHMEIVQGKYFKFWKGKDPWTYNADADQIKTRKLSLNRLIRESDRYKTMRQKYLTKVTAEVEEKYTDARLWDADINRLKKAESDKNYLARLVREDIISRNQKATYEKILKDSLWQSVKVQSSRFTDNVKKAFAKEADMVVYDYVTGKEKKTRMTPMDSIRYHRMHMQLGSVSIDPRNGEVRTWVGGINNKYFQYDHVLADRQVGSTFKPFVYATAISQQALSPCLQVEDIQYTIPANDSNFGLMQAWSPSNASGFTRKRMTLMEGLKTSTNSISVWLMIQLGSPQLVIDMASRMGVDKRKIPNAPSIALGSANLNVLEMTAAYCTFANNGVYNKPSFIRRIEDKNGKIIYQSTPEKRRVLSEKYNHVMVEMLKYAASFVQGRLETTFGGKTGTTNDYVDGWFMGVTPELVTGTWVGGEDQWIKFETLADGQGGRMARPYFLNFMQKVEASENVDYDATVQFYEPQGDRVEMNCSKYSQFSQEYPSTTTATDSTGQSQTTPPPNGQPRFEKVIELDEFEEEF